MRDGSRYRGSGADVQCCYICCKSGEAQEYPVGHGEDLCIQIYRHQQTIQSTTTLTHTFVKLDEMPSAWFPSRRSEAMATQSFPTMAITEPPLYSIIDYHREILSTRGGFHARSHSPCWANVTGREDRKEGRMEERMEENA